MKRFLQTSACLLALTISGPAVISAMAAPMPIQDQDRDHDRNRDQRDDSAYTNNRYYKQGWRDGGRHKRSNKHWKNDNDRSAYEAGYAHGDRGEQWKDKDKDHDRDHDRR